ncbi:hypothetical protein CASFOL_030179 [Castilleja foliolosa]|uniref:Uncharacterized protein n=1 Tax=Castilleja foliolosa TaxID=1961234 RepID=A0ABD3C9X6_9LAMI
MCWSTSMLKDTILIQEAEVLKRLKNESDVKLALDYFKYISNSSSFKHTQLTYRTMIQKLGHIGEMDALLGENRFHMINPLYA